MPFSESTFLAGRSTKTESSGGSSLMQDVKHSQSAPRGLVVSKQPPGSPSLTVRRSSAEADDEFEPQHEGWVWFPV